MVIRDYFELPHVRITRATIREVANGFNQSLWAGCVHLISPSFRHSFTTLCAVNTDMELSLPTRSDKGQYPPLPGAFNEMILVGELASRCEREADFAQPAQLAFLEFDISNLHGKAPLESTFAFDAEQRASKQFTKGRADS